MISAPPIGPRSNSSISPTHCPLKMCDMDSIPLAEHYWHNALTMINLTPKQLRKAADIQEKIQSLQEELGQILGGEVSSPAQATEPGKKYKFSPAARAKMRAAQKARWAKIKGTVPSALPTDEPKKKNKMSAEGLANIRAGGAKRMAGQGKAPATKGKMSTAGLANIQAAQKARWAKAKKTG